MPIEPALATLAVHAGEERGKSRRRDRRRHFFALPRTPSRTVRRSWISSTETHVRSTAGTATPTSAWSSRSSPLLMAVNRRYCFPAAYAIVTLLMAKHNAGDEIVFRRVYHRSREFCVKHLSRFGVTTRQVKTGDYEALASAVTPATKLLVSNPTNSAPQRCRSRTLRGDRPNGPSRDTDRRDAGDSYNQGPRRRRGLRAFGDQILGRAQRSVGGRRGWGRGQAPPVRQLRGILGTITSPHVAYLLQRGLKTLALRMEQHNRNG